MILLEVPLEEGDVSRCPEGKPVDDPAGDAPFGRKCRGRGLGREPAGILQFFPVNDNLATGVVGHEPGHELAREGPVLASHVPEIGDFYPGLFSNLAPGALFQRFTWVEKPGDEAVAALWPDGLAAKQEFVIPSDEDDGAWVRGRKAFQTAVDAASAPASGVSFHATAAPGAVGTIAVPGEQISGDASEGEELVIQTVAVGVERFRRERRRE